MEDERRGDHCAQGCCESTPLSEIERLMHAVLDGQHPEDDIADDEAQQLLNALRLDEQARKDFSILAVNEELLRQHFCDGSA